jgi:hypothetical protein
MTTTGGAATYPGGAGATGATTQLVRPRRSVPPTAITANHRFKDTILSSPTRLRISSGGHLASPEDQPTGATRRGQDRGGTRIYPLREHIPCQRPSSRPYDVSRGRPVSFITQMPHVSQRMNRIPSRKPFKRFPCKSYNTVPLQSSHVALPSGPTTRQECSVLIPHMRACSTGCS